MKTEPTQAELELAARINDLEDAALRPPVPGGGLFGAAFNFLGSHVPKGLAIAVLAVVIAYHGWDAVNKLQLMQAELGIKHGETGQTQAEARAVNTQAEGATLLQKKLEADLKEIQAKADAAEAEASAATHSVGGATARLRQLRAELEQKRQDARSTRADAEAASQSIHNVEMSVAQKRAEIAQADAEAAKIEAKFRIFLSDEHPGSSSNRNLGRWLRTGD